MDKLIENADIVRFAKSRRIAWLGHVMRMNDKRTPQRISEWKPIGTRIRGRPRKRWIVDIEWWRKKWNGREPLRRLKLTVGGNASKRRRRSQLSEEVSFQRDALKSPPLIHF